MGSDCWINLKVLLMIIIAEIKKITRCLTLLPLLCGPLPGQLETPSGDGDFVYTEPGEETYWLAVLYSGLGEEYAGEAADLLRKSAEAGFGEAHNQVGVHYLNGYEGFRQSNRRAHLAFRQGAEAGSFYAMVNLANTYLTGTGCWRSPRKAREWALRAADPDADYYESGPRADLYERLPEDARFEDPFSRGQATLSEEKPAPADLTRNFARTLLGFIAREEDEDETAALRWFRLASDLENEGFAGIQPAVVNAALGYALGKGTERDIEEADRYLRTFRKMGKRSVNAFANTMYQAEQLNQLDLLEAKEEGQAAVADMYESLRLDIGIALYRDEEEAFHDPSEAVRWLEKAAVAKDGFAEYHLGMIFLDTAPPHDPVKGRRFLAESWAEGYLGLAGVNFAHAMIQGIGGPSEKNRAHEILEQLTDFSGVPRHLLKGNELEGFLTFEELIEMDGELAEAGNPDAKHAQSMRYYLGIGVRPNGRKARSLLEEAAARGQSDAIIFQALREKGKENPDMAEVRRLLWKAADRRNADAFYQLARLSEEENPEHGIFERMEWLEKAVQIAPRHFAALDRLAREHYALLKSNYYRNDPEGERRSVSRMEEIAATLSDNHQGSGARILGVMHLEGEVFPADPERAYELFEEAVEFEDGDAHYYLGKMHEEGIGRPVNPQQAELQFRKCGYSDATHDELRHKILRQLLGEYKSGRSEFRNPSVALRWAAILTDMGYYRFGREIGDQLMAMESYRAAASFFKDVTVGWAPDFELIKGHAHYRLGQMYDEGHHYAADPSWAEYHYSHAVKEGHPEAYYWAADRILASEEALPGMEFMKLAARSGSVNANLYLADHYMNPVGEPADRERGIRHLKKAVRLHSAEAMVRLARMTLEEEKAPLDFETAYEYLERAYNLDHPQAEFYLDQMEEEMDRKSRQPREGSSLDSRLG